MVRTKIKPFLKRKKVPKFYFHFGQQKKCPPFSFYIYLQSEIPLSSNGVYGFAVAVGRQSAIYTDYSGFASPALGSAHFHVSWLSDFIFYQKPLYNSLHQSFFYSFITILPSESGVTLHYSTIFPQILLFRHSTSIFQTFVT